MKKSTTVILIIITVLFTLVSCNGSEDIEKSKYKNNYIDIPITKVNSEGLTWPTDQALPTFPPMADNIDAIDITTKSSFDRSMLSTFAGIINRKQPRVMLHFSDDPDKWPEELGIKYNLTKDYYSIIRKYESEIKGLIVWDSKVADTLNLATSLAGLKDALVVNQKQKENLIKEGFSFPTIEDFRDRFKDKSEVYTYLYDNVWNNCEKRLIVGIDPKSGWELRDLAVAANAAVIWFNPKEVSDINLFKKFLKDCTPGEAYYIGWWTSEGDGVGLASTYGIPTIPGDYYYNYSVYSSMSRELDIPIVPAKPALENKFYISFTISDGDNIQYIQHSLKRDSDKLWASKDRGAYPINWTFQPAMLDAGPQILNYYFKTSTENDLLICGPSGVGYTYPTDWDRPTSGKDALIKYALRTDKYFRRINFNMITVWNYVNQSHADLYAKNIRSLIGFSIQVDDMKISPQIVQGKIPLVTTEPRYDGQTPRVQKIIEDKINVWDGKSPAFMMPQLISWEAGTRDVVKIANALKAKYGDKVAFVRGDHFMMLNAEANGIPYNVILQSKNITASGSDDGYDVSKIVDGSFAKDKGWKYSGKGDKWITIDLQGEYKLSRYVLKNAGSGYFDESFNIKGYKIQSSMDGVSWNDIDVVTANKSNIVDKDVDAFNAKYVRIFITDTGADEAARIQDFELYGVKI